MFDFHDSPAGGPVQDAQSAARRAENRADALLNEMMRLRHRVDRLALGCQALWEILRDRYGLRDEELRDQILAVDLRDGKTDGTISTTITDCPKCGNKTNSKRDTCVFCGAPLVRPQAFET